jgi:hypothetical protein
MLANPDIGVTQVPHRASSATLYQLHFRRADREYPDV